MYCLAFFGFTLKVFVVFQYKNTEPVVDIWAVWS